MKAYVVITGLYLFLAFLSFVFSIFIFFIKNDIPFAFYFLILSFSLELYTNRRMNLIKKKVD